jgi:dTDP-glucose pyrophosphorylase
MWGIVPAAGKGTRIQPLAFSKELLPVGTRDHEGQRRPRAVSDYLVERLVIAGATRICFVISPSKSDIIEYYGGSVYGMPVCYCVQPEPRGLCDAIFRALACVGREEAVVVGLPDTVWFPKDALCSLADDALSFLLFPVEHPQFFDAVVADADGNVQEIQVKQPAPATHWVWGAFKMPGRVLHDLHELWQSRGDEYVGTLVNAWLAQGGRAHAVRAGRSYLDVGAMDGYLQAVRTLTYSEPQAAVPGDNP